MLAALSRFKIPRRPSSELLLRCIFEQKVERGELSPLTLSSVTCSRKVGGVRDVSTSSTLCTKVRGNSKKREMSEKKLVCYVKAYFTRLISQDICIFTKHKHTCRGDYQSRKHGSLYCDIASFCASQTRHFVDHRRVKLVAGSGGKGASSFHSEPRKEWGGPDGGNGGDGGSIIIKGKFDWLQECLFALFAM